MNHFDQTSEFRKEFKRLFKRYKTLDDDFKKFKGILAFSPPGVGKNFVIIHVAKEVRVLKARMACRSLNSRSLRIIYSYSEEEKQIQFIEIYFKGDKENEDRQRIKRYLANTR